MNRAWRVILVVPLVVLSLTVASAQTSASVEKLRSQLSDMQVKEAELQTRLKQLNEDLQPENLEKYFALNGSTRPEELREQRRRQLESQKALLLTQIDQVAASRARLEAGIATAEAAAYRQSALSETSNSPAAVTDVATPAAVKPTQTKRRARPKRARYRRRRG